MGKIRKFAVLLICLIVITASVPVFKTEIAAEEETGENTEEEITAEEETETGENTVTCSLADIQYVYIELSIAAIGETQNIVVALADENAEIESASLTIVSPETEAKTVLTSSSVCGNAVLFTEQYEDESEATNYELTSFEYTISDSDYTYVIALDSSDGYIFEVVTEETKSTIESASSDEEDITVYTISDSGALEATSGSTSISFTNNSDDTLVIALDPGHGGTDSGATANGLVESELNWKIMTYCKAELETYANVEVVVTKTENETVSLQTRADRAYEYGADVLISIHCNSSGSSGGVEIWVPNDSSYYYSLYTAGQELGTDILDQLASLGLKKRGVYTRDSDSYTYEDGSVADYYGIIRHAREYGILGIIIEHLFVDVSSDAAYLKKDSNLKKLGVADATAIAEYFSLTKVATVQYSSVTLAANLESVTLKWSKTTGADGYQIYRKTSSGSYKLVKTISGGSTVTWTDSSITLGETYYYKIRAYSSDSGTKEYGNYSSAVKVAVKPPQVVIGSVTMTADYTSATITWGKVASASGYRIYRKTSSGSYELVKTISGSSTVTWTDSTLEAGETYYYRIRAYKTDSGGTKVYGSYSSEVEVPAKPAKVTVSSVSYSASTGYITVKWSAVDGAEGYEIYRSADGGSYEKLATVKSGSTVKYTDKTVSKGVTYKYKIRAYDTIETTTTETLSFTDSDTNTTTEIDIVSTDTSTLKGSFGSAKSVFAGLRGDANNDGKVSTADYIAVKNHILSIKKITGNVKLAQADANADDKISSADYVWIKNKILSKN